MSKLETNTIDTISGSNTLTLGGTNLSTVNMASGVSPGTGMGKVLQVKSATKTDTQSSTSQTFADVTGMSVSITPSSTSSKILAFGYCNAAYQNALSKVGIQLVRDTTNILIGDASGSRTRLTGFAYVASSNLAPVPLAFNFLDSPSTTSATTYKIQFARLDPQGTVYVNRSTTDSNSVITGRTASTITVMEIAG